MRDTLTKAERSLVRSGMSQHVRQTRRCFQETMREDIVSGVQELTGRRVIAFLSDNHIDPDVAVETILPEPQRAGDDPPDTMGIA
jgi:uncharacterized protein YbcI